MDCRKPLVLALGLAAGLAGCATTHTTISPTAQGPAVGPTSEIVVKKAVDPPKHNPQAMTCVAYGDFANDEASHAENTVDRDEKRNIARKAYQQALSLDSKCLPAYQGLARLYVAMKDYQHAVTTYQEAQRHFPKEPSLYYELGMCYGQQKQWEPALQNLSKAAELDPENRLFNNILGYATARAGRYDESVKVFQRLETEQEANYRVAWMLKHVNEPELARQHLIVALQKDPQMESALALFSELSGGGATQAPAPPEIQQASFIKEVTPLPQGQQ
jgi:tetratricopeptide (TPR) repeat protein